MSQQEYIDRLRTFRGKWCTHKHMEFLTFLDKNKRYISFYCTKCLLIITKRNDWPLDEAKKRMQEWENSIKNRKGRKKQK